MLQLCIERVRGSVFVARARKNGARLRDTARAAERLRHLLIWKLIALFEEGVRSRALDCAATASCSGSGRAGGGGGGGGICDWCRRRMDVGAVGGGGGSGGRGGGANDAVV